MGRVVFTSIIMAIFVFLCLATPVYACSKVYKRTADSKKPVQTLLERHEVLELEHKLLGDLYDEGHLHTEEQDCWRCKGEKNPPKRKEAYRDEMVTGLYTYSKYLSMRDRENLQRCAVAQQREARYRKYKQLYGDRTAKAMIEREKK